MTSILDPEQLGPEARACFTRIQKRLREQNAWREEYAIGLAPMAARCAEYLEAARKVRTLDVPPEILRLYQTVLKRTHRITRYWLGQWFDPLPPPEMNAEGEDAVIAKLCAPLPKLASSLIATENW